MAKNDEFIKQDGDATKKLPGLTRVEAFITLPTAMFACAPSAETVAAYWAAGRTPEEAALMQAKFVQRCASQGCVNEFPFTPIDDDVLLVCASCWQSQKPQ